MLYSCYVAIFGLRMGLKNSFTGISGQQPFTSSTCIGFLFATDMPHVNLAGKFATKQAQESLAAATAAAAATS